MKTFTLIFAMVAAVTISKAQGLQAVVVEKYYETNAADAAWASTNGASTTLTPGSVVYRVYIDMAPGYKFVQLFGNNSLGTLLHPLVIKTTTNFYNDPNNGQAIGPQANSVNNTKQGTTLIDSYITVGGVCAGKAGVLKTEDTDGSIGNSSNILTNNSGGIFGAPINSVVAGAKDGLMPGTLLAPSVLGIGSEKDVLDQTPGSTFSCSNCAIAALGGAVGTTTSNMVLIGQFTTDGVLSFSLNVQLSPTVNPTASETYVASNVQPGETLFPGLIYSSATTGTVVGIESITTTHELPLLSVYPNPSHGFFNINATNVKESVNNSYSIYDVSGRLVFSKNLGKVPTRFTEVVDLSTFKDGLYFVSVSLDGAVTTRKIVKE
jgi:hypothetical protein